MFRRSRERTAFCHSDESLEPLEIDIHRPPSPSSQFNTLVNIMHLFHSKSNLYDRYQLITERSDSRRADKQLALKRLTRGKLAAVYPIGSVTALVRRQIIINAAWLSTAADDALLAAWGRSTRSSACAGIRQARIRCDRRATSMERELRGRASFG